MSEALDRDLKAGLLAPPAGFAARVMAEVVSQPLPVRRDRTRAAIEWLALAGAVLAGLAQLLPFLFGVWTVSNAG